MNHPERQLSVESRNFLEDLKIYLVSSGKDSKEIEDIVNELEVHLIEAEGSGKSVDQVIGQSPGEYMAKISREMPTDFSSLFKHMLLITFGGFSFTIIKDLLKGPLSYSLIELIGYVSIAVLFIIVLMGGLKYLSAHKVSRDKQAMAYYTIGLFPIILFVAMYLLNRQIKTPVIHFGITRTAIIGVITVLFLIAVSLWAITWSIFILVGLVTLPDALLRLMNLQQMDRDLFGFFITIGGILFYLWLSVELKKRRIEKYK